MPKLKWQDSQEIGYQLAKAHPELDPLSVSFVKLRELVLALPEFASDPAASNEGILESIQMAWLEERD